MENIAQFIERHEAYRKDLYDDETGEKYEKGKPVEGNLTIGIGWNVEAGCPHDLAIRILEYFIDKALEDLYIIFGKPYFDNLDEPRRLVLIDMMFNMGKNRFNGFKNTIAAIKSGQFGLAADEMMDSLWYDQVKTRAKELVQIMREGRFLTTEELNSL